MKRILFFFAFAIAMAFSPVMSATVEKSYTIEFKTGNSADGSALSTSVQLSNIISTESLSYVSGLKSASTAYYNSTNGLRLGSGSNVGSVELNLTSEAQVAPTKIVANIAFYGKDSSAQIGINTNSTSNVSSVGDYTVTYNNPTKITSLSLYMKRGYIKSVTVYYQQEEGDNNDPVTPPSGDAVDVTYDATAQGYSNAQSVESATVPPITFTFSKGSNTSNGPTYYDSGAALRCYYGNTITISSTNKSTITKVEFGYGTGDNGNSLSSDKGDFDGTNWSGTEETIVFTIGQSSEGKSSGNRRIQTITVTYLGEEVTVIEVPVFNPKPEDGPIDLETPIYLTCATDGAIIYYMTNDMTNEDDEKQVYDDEVGIIVTADNNYIKAWAVLDGTQSEKVEATYTFNKVAAPTFTPEITKVSKGTEVTISCSTEGHTIYYKLLSESDEVEDKEYSIYYPGTTEIIIEDNTIIYAKATKQDWLDSEEVKVEYSIVGANDQVENTATFDFSENGNAASLTTSTVEPGGNNATNNSLNGVEFNAEGIKLSFAKGNHTTSEPRWWSDNVVRVYGTDNMQNTMTLTAPAGYAITEVSFTQATSGSGNDGFSFTPSTGSFSDKVWSDSEKKRPNEIVFTATGPTRFVTVDVSCNRTAYTPYPESSEFKVGGKHVYKVNHGMILVEKVQDSNSILRFAAAERDEAPENWEYEDDQTAVYTVPETDTNIYKIYGIFNDEKSEPITFTHGVATGITSIEDLDAAEVEFFNLQGVKVANPDKGIFIVKKGNKTEKVVL